MSAHPRPEDESHTPPPTAEAPQRDPHRPDPHRTPAAPGHTLADALLAGGAHPDPTRVRTLPAGDLFDLVSVDLPIGLDALDLMLRAGQPLGPVLADTRHLVRRAGFLLAPGTLARARGLAWWCRGHGVRTCAPGAVVALPPPVTDPADRVQWLVAPDAAPGGETDPAALLGALRRALRHAAAQHLAPVSLLSAPPAAPRRPIG